MAAWRHSSPQEPSQPYPHTGTRRHGGFRKLFAYMRMKVLGTRTPATGTTEGFSSYPELGVRLADTVDPIYHRFLSRYIAPGSFTGGTATHGESGEQLVCVGFSWYRTTVVNGNIVSIVHADPPEYVLAWDRANREALDD